MKKENTLELGQKVIAVVTMPYKDARNERRLYYAVVKGKIFKKLNSGYIVEFNGTNYFMKRYIHGLKFASLYQRFAYMLIPFNQETWNNIKKILSGIEKLGQGIDKATQLRQANWDNLMDSLFKLNILEIKE